MFKSTYEWDAAIYRFLVEIRDNRPNLETLLSTLQLDDEEFSDVVRRSLDLGLVEGITVSRNVGGYALDSWSPPKVTYNGLAFIEQFERTFSDRLE